MSERDRKVDRECPHCGAEKVCSMREARQVYLSFDYIERADDSSATHVCTSCRRPVAV